ARGRRTGPRAPSPAAGRRSRGSADRPRGSGGATPRGPGAAPRAWPGSGGGGRRGGAPAGRGGGGGGAAGGVAGGAAGVGGGRGGKGGWPTQQKTSQPMAHLGSAMVGSASGLLVAACPGQRGSGQRSSLQTNGTGPSRVKKRR